MDTQNHFYSHGGVLAAYVGLRRPRHLGGLLQHGWTTISPVAANFGDFSRVDGRGRRRLLVWSHESRAWDPSVEPARTDAVGAPWLYLGRLAGLENRYRTADPAGADSDGPTVVLPVHGTRVVRWEGDHARLAEEVREREGSVLVSVHHEDLHDPAVVGGWRGAGHELVSSGARQDPDFLPRQLRLMSGAGRVVSNRLSTAILYAAAIGVPVAVYGDPFASTGSERASYDSIRERWPEFHGEVTDLAATTEVARRELGVAHVRDAGELRRLLGWGPPISPGPALDYWTRGPLEKALRVAGLRARVEAGPRQESSVGASTWLRHPLSHLPGPLSRRLPQIAPLPEPLRPA
jgi:hypothetical protein